MGQFTESGTGSTNMCFKLSPKIRLDLLIIDNQIINFDEVRINNVKSSKSDTLYLFSGILFFF